MAEPTSQQYLKRMQLLVMLLLAMIVALTGWDIYQDYRSDLDLIRERQRSYSAALAEHANRTLINGELLLKLVQTELQALPDPIQVPEKQLYDLLHRLLPDAPNISSIFLVSPQGQIKAVTLGYPTKQIVVEDRDYFIHHRDHNDTLPYYSRPFQSRIDNTWRFSISRRLNRADGSFNGLIGVSQGVEYYQQFYQHLQPLATERISLLRRDGYPQIVVPVQQLNDTVRLLEPQRLFSSHSGSFTGRLFENDRTDRLCSFHQVEGAPLVATISIDQAAIHQDWRKKTALKLASALAAVVLIIWLIRRLSNELQRSRTQLEQLVAERTSQLSETSHELALNQLRLEALLEISQYQASDLQGMLDFSLAKVLKITASQFGYIYHYHEDRQEFVLNTWSRGVMPACSVTDPQTVYQLDKTGIWGEAVRQRKAILINDFSAENPLKKGYPEGHVPLNRFLTVPVFDHQQRIVAVVGVANKQLPYTEQDQQQLELMMAEVWRIVKRLELEQKLVQAGRQWQTSFDAISDSMAVLDLDQRVLRCNLATTRILNLPFSEIVGRHCWELLHRTSHQIDGCPMERVRQSRVSESELLFEGGRWLRVTVDPVLDEQGQLVGAVHIIRDETERITADQAQQELLAMLEAVQNELYVFSPDTLRFEYVNQTALRNLGYTRDQLLQLTPPDMTVIRHSELIRLLMPLLLGEQKSLLFETEQRRADGSSYPVESHLQLVQTHSGPRYLAVVHDITERQQAQARLQEALQAARNFRTALDYVSAHIYIKDLESRYIYANRPTLELFGCTAEELPGSPDSRFFPPEVVEQLHLIDQRVFSGEHTAEEVVVSMPDGSSKVYLELKTPFYADEENELISGLLGISTDITDLKQSEQELQQLQAQMLQNEKMASIGQLSAGIAHEINNPLSGILIFSSLAAKDKRLDPALKGDLETISSEAQRCAGIVKGLLEFARDYQPKMTVCDINQVVIDSLRLVECQSVFQNVAILRQLANDLPQIMADQNQLKQVFINIFINAGQAMQDLKRGELKIITARSGDPAGGVLVRISDSGCGVPAEQLGKLFDPFFTTKGTGGTGLGLSVSYGIIKAHGGTIKAESDVGMGMTFIINLPCCAEGITPPPDTDPTLLA